MKLKKIKVSSRYLKKRLLTSILVGLFFFIAGILAFKYVQTKSAQSDGAPILLRHSFVWNEKVWSRLSSKKHLSVNKKKPPSQHEPRVNGDVGLEDEVDSKNYSIKILNGSNNLTLPISAFYALPKIGYSTDFRCIEGWSEEIQYAGARFSDFMTFYHLGKKTDGNYYKYVGLETPDQKYYVSIDIESMLHPQTVLAYEMNESPLSEENGAPLRLVIPIKYGIKNLKRIGKIIFSDDRLRDYWFEKGYDWYSGL